MSHHAGKLLTFTLLAAVAIATDASAAFVTTPADVITAGPPRSAVIAVKDATPPVTPPQVIVPPDQCGTELKIIQAMPLQFGIISVDHGAGGVVIVSPNGAVATLGGVAVGPDAGPATIRLCGPAGEEFQVLVEPTQLDLAAGNFGARPHVVHDLEANVSGAELHPTGDGQWQGTLGAIGTAEIRIGGTLTIPVGQGRGNFAAPFRIRIDPLK